MRCTIPSRYVYNLRYIILQTQYNLCHNLVISLCKQVTKLINLQGADNTEHTWFCGAQLGHVINV